MLSYQHAYHAGNPADVHKHSVFATLLHRLVQKRRPISVVETHAGRGLYDLSSPEAVKTGESEEGILRIENLSGFGVFDEIVREVREVHDKVIYPGSPLVAQMLLRERDKHVLMEKHPQEVAALKRNFHPYSAHIHHRDGYEGVLGLSPFTPRKGLVLIDPSYEVKDEYERVATFIPALMKKWPEATVALWYPKLAAGYHSPMLASLGKLDPIISEVSFTLKSGRGMQASGMTIFAAPYGSDADIAALEAAFTAQFTAR